MSCAGHARYCASLHHDGRYGTMGDIDLDVSRMVNYVVTFATHESQDMTDAETALAVSHICRIAMSSCRLDD
jgi:hypothetical protein